MKYFVRTTGERTLDESFSQIEYALLIDKNREYVKFFAKSLCEIKEDCVILEDDIVLCKDFNNRILKAVEEFPNDVINFFTWNCNKYYLTRRSNNFLLNQCTYYPKELVQNIGKEMLKVLKEFPSYATDEIENIALQRLGLTHIQYRPCLVQHLNFDSMLKHNVETIRSPFFIDYLDKIKVDYKNVCAPVINTLNKLMNEHIEEKRKEWEENGKVLCKNNTRKKT